MLDYEKELKEKQDEIDYLRSSLKKAEVELQNLRSRIIPIRSRHGISKERIEPFNEDSHYEEYITNYMLEAVGKFLYDNGYIKISKGHNVILNVPELIMDFTIFKTDEVEDIKDEKM